MKYKGITARIKAINVTEAIYVQDVGWSARIRLSLELKPTDDIEIEVDELEAIAAIRAQSMSITGDGPNRYHLQAKRDFGAVQHVFTDGKASVMTVCAVKQFRANVVGGDDVFITYHADTQTTLADLAQLIAMMDDHVSLTTTGVQVDLFPDAVKPKTRKAADATQAEATAA